MSLTKKMFSKKFFLVNLVLVGIIIGFVAAFAIFAKTNSSNTAIAHADTSPARKPIQAADISAAKSIQAAFNNIATTVLPSVVEIDVVASQSIKRGTEFPWKFFFGTPDPDKEDTIPKDEFEEEGLGSGILVRKDGKKIYVLTNNHVVEGAKKITVKLYNKKEYEGKLVGVDKRRDIAVILFETADTDIHIATLGNSDSLQVGDWAIAIGSPFGLVSSMTVGIVSAIGRDGGPDGNINDFIQTDASINKGNSGGALANIDGEVVGINTWIASNTGGSVGLGFSIPINNAVRAVDDIIKKGKVTYGWLGVQLSPINKEIKSDLKLDNTEGAFIVQVFSDGPAANSGIFPGDYVTEIDGKKITSIEHLTRIVGDLPAGAKSVFKLIRNGKSMSVKVSIEERNEDIAADQSKLWPGMDVRPLSSEAIAELKLPKTTQGIIVASVAAKSPMATLTIKSGDIITAINDSPIKNLADFYIAINDAKQKKIQFTILRDGKTLSTLALIKK